MVNGKPDDRLPLTDRGLLYGDGLFETVAIVEGQPLLWQEHLNRLQRGCECLGLQRPDEIDV